MKLSTISIALLPALVKGQGSVSQWHPPGPHDFRGPCPMMNTLANHGFLPHNGRNITKPNAIHALSTALNFNESLAAIMWEQAIIANPEPNATFFTLDHLNRHNVLEHDASLSRSDAFFGNNHVFNQSIFDWTRQFWTGAVLTADMLANGKVARQVMSRAFNPTYTFTTTTEAFSLGEVAAPIIVFGDHASATVKRNLIEYFFQHERLPSKLGWTKQKQVVNVEDVNRLSGIIGDANNLTTPAQGDQVEARGDIHSGFSQ